MATKYHQIVLSDIFLDCQSKPIDDLSLFFTPFSEYFDMDNFIPPQFQAAFYLSLVRKRVYSMHGFSYCIISSEFFSFLPIPSFFSFFTYAKNCRMFMFFSKVPDTSLLSRFKYDFVPTLNST